MKRQAVRRSAAYLRLRTWWRGLDLATAADVLLCAFVLAAWALVSALGPLLLAPGGAQ